MFTNYLIQNYFMNNGLHYIFPESELLEAQALYDFCARSPREVNFNKGDTITLFKQVRNVKT